MIQKLPRARESWSLAALVALIAAAGCSDKSDDTGASVGLPDETDTVSLIGDSVALIADTFSDGLGDDQPTHWLTLSQEGQWDLTPRGGPWTTLTGELHATEVLDDDEENPTCDVTYALTGETYDGEPCDTCDDAFTVSFYVTAGSPDDCADPDLPTADEPRIFGWSAVDSTIYLNYADMGVWLPWYEGTLDEDTLSYTWTTKLAKYVEEDSGQ